MSEIFEIPLLNPMRFIGATGARFDSLPAVELINAWQERKCYFQKWQTSDSTRLQILSDFPDITFKIFDLDTGQEVLDIVPLVQDATLVGETFKVYEIPVDFVLLPEGDYYAELSYQNADPQTISFLSEPFSVRDSWEKTILFKYRNDINNFSIVFDTGITFDIRLEGVITDFSPQAEDVIYNDQKRNATMLDSVPWRQFKLYIGDAPGVPPWVADKANRVMSCNQVRIDGDYFEKIEGAAWETERADEYAFIGLTLDIMPVENFFLQQLETGDEMATIRVVQKANNYFDVEGSLTVPGIFDRYKKLDELVIENDGPPFTLLVGITSGGSEIGEFEVSDPNTTIDIDHYFRANATLYLSGFPGILAMVSVIWKELDADPIDLGEGGGPAPAAGLGIGAVVIYEASEVQFNTDFDLSSGLGRDGTAWLGWAVCDGRNGTVNRGGLIPVGWQNGSERFGEIGAVGGAEKVTIQRAHLPNEQLDVPIPASQTSRHDTGTGRITTGGAETEPADGPTLQSETLGSGEQLDIMNPYVVSVFVKKIS